MSDHESSRRQVLKNSIALGGLAASASMPFWSKLALGAGEELVQFTDMPEGFSAPPVTPGGFHFLDTRGINSFYTPTDDFYIVQHYNQPVIPNDEYRLRITGMVENSLNISLAELKRRPKMEIDAGFECGGNNKGMYHGLIGNARWGGTSLRELLREAKIQNGGNEIVFYGADKGMENTRDLETEQSFGRSMNFNDAMSPDIMVAYEMNGEPLNLYHGAPVRLIVPGWYGVANVKWMEQIHIQDSRYMGRFMARDYVTLSKREIGGVERWEERSVTKIHLKSSIVRVTKDGGKHNITGFVLNDGTPLSTVEIKIDDGPWQQAKIDPDATKYSWKLFSYEWKNATPGEHTIVSRAIDTDGQIQARPDQMPEKPSIWENYEQFPRTVMIA